MHGQANRNKNYFSIYYSTVFEKNDFLWFYLFVVAFKWHFVKVLLQIAWIFPEKIHQKRQKNVQTEKKRKRKGRKYHSCFGGEGSSTVAYSPHTKREKRKTYSSHGRA